MKRSEMIKVIRSIIILDDGMNGLAPIDRPEVSELILDEMETAGMLPPFSREGVKLFDGYDTENIPVYKYNRAHKWEEE